MTSYKVIGITGGIGSGKSTVAKVFSTLGYKVYEADLRAKYLINNSLELKNKLIEFFGHEIYLPSGAYNVPFVSSLVFNNPDLLQKINSVVHPAVAEDFDVWRSENSKELLLFKEAAIMSKNSGLDAIIYVNTSEKIRIERLLKRDAHRNEEQILKIMNNQKSEAEFRKISDFEINNNENMLVLPQINEILKKLLS